MCYVFMAGLSSHLHKSDAEAWIQLLLPKATFMGRISWRRWDGRLSLYVFGHTVRPNIFSHSLSAHEAEIRITSYQCLSDVMHSIAQDGNAGGRLKAKRKLEHSHLLSE